MDKFVIDNRIHAGPMGMTEAGSPVGAEVVSDAGID